MFFLFNYHILENRQGKKELEFGKTCHGYPSDCAQLKQGWKTIHVPSGEMSKAALVSAVCFSSAGYQVCMNW